MRRLSSLFAFLVVSNLSVQAETAAKSLDLFNGKDFSGWEFFTPDQSATLKGVCHLKSDGVIAVDGKPNGYLQAPGTWENYRLHVEWRWSGKAGNGGVLLHIASGPLDRNTWPLSIQVQTKNKSVGDLLPMAGAKFIDHLSSGPVGAPPFRVHQQTDSENPVGYWNTCEVVSRTGTLEVTINGVLQNKVTGCQPSSGKIGFQLEGVPFEMRNLSVEVLR